jgi:hypothetical protein
MGIFGPVCAFCPGDNSSEEALSEALEGISCSIRDKMAVINDQRMDPEI